MTIDIAPNAARIRELNDLLRTTFMGGRVFITEGVCALGASFESGCVEAVQSFSTFDAKNDPYAEHDFGIVKLEGHTVYWKIDYYNRTLDGGSSDPADPAITTRVLTILLAGEY